MKHFSWLNKKGTTETCCTSGLCMTKDQDERIRLLQKIARDHSKEDRIKELDDDESRKAEEHEKEKKIEAYKAEIKDLDDDELDELLESLRAELEDLKKQLNPNKEDEEKLSKSAEFIGVHNYQSASIDGDDAIDQLQTLQRYRHRQKKSSHSYDKSYSVLTLKPYESVSGDSLLIKMGSTDSDSVSDTSGDELLRKLGSTD